MLWSGSIYILNEETAEISLAKTMPRKDGTSVDPVTAMARVQGARYCSCTIRATLTYVRQLVFQCKWQGYSLDDR